MTNSDEDDPIYAAMSPEERDRLDAAEILAVLRSIDGKLDKLTGG